MINHGYVLKESRMHIMCVLEKLSTVAYSRKKQLRVAIANFQPDIVHNFFPCGGLYKRYIIIVQYAHV
jgi:hypothetical protein